MHNIAALADGVTLAAKAALPPVDLSDGLVRENDAWAAQIAQPAAASLMQGALQRGAQTPTGERRLEELLRGL